MLLRIPVRLLCIALSMCVFSAAIRAQESAALIAGNNVLENRTETTIPKPILVSVLPKYFNPQNGVSINDLIKAAIASNQDLAATRLEIDKARTKLNQARLRPNPTLEVEQSSGAVLGSPGGGQFTVGASFPLEIYGRRSARINVAEIEIQASEAQVRNRERLLAAQILANYAEALGALRELEATERLLELDLQTTKVVQLRVNEGDVAPLELNLLQAEIERLRSRRQLAEGRLGATLIQLKTFAGISFDDPLVLREQLATAALPSLPVISDATINSALSTRPDIILTQIEEQVATAGLRLISAQSRPDLTAYSRYTEGRLGFRNVIDGPYQSRDRSLTFGIAVILPVFNKNQGNKAAAEINIRQAQARREYAERVVRGEVLTASQRLESARQAVRTLENAALPRANENVEVFRRVYELGEIKITDLIAEQRRLLDATRDLTEALTARYRAQADLTIALGAAGLLPETK